MEEIRTERGYELEEIRTERLILRRFKEDDGQDLYECLSDEEVVKYEPYKTSSKMEAYEEAIRRTKSKNFIVVCLQDGKLIGNLYLAEDDFDTWEIGYLFNRKYWGNGYASESVKSMMKYIFEDLNARRIVAMCDPKNEKSWHLLERLGMRREGTLIENVFFFKDDNGDPIWKDTYEYAMLKSEYE